MQMAEESGWVDLYGFLPHPVPHIDVETVNWWISTHPHSPFVTGLIVSSLDDAGARTSLSDWSELALTEHTPAGKHVTPLDRPAIPAAAGLTLRARRVRA